MVQVLCPEARREAVVARLLGETTSIGVRYYGVHRRILSREIRDMETPYGVVQVKCITYPDGRLRMAPEYEACKTIALRDGLPIQTVYDTISKSIDK